jgi:type I restriction enzyme, S subunit
VNTTSRLRWVVKYTASGPSPTCDDRNIEPPYEWGVLKTTAIQWTGWREDEHKTLPKEFWGAKHLEVHKGDVLVTKAGPRQRVGVSAYVDKTQPRLIVSGKMIMLRVDESAIDPRYLNWQLATPAPQAYLNAFKSGMAEAQMNFANEDLLSMKIDLPPLDEQRRIADFLDIETAQIDGLAATRQRMRELLVLKRERMAEQILGLDTGPRMIPLKYEVQSVSVGIVITPASWYVDSGGVIALRGLNVRPGHIDTSDVVRISHTGHQENIKSRLSRGNVVVVRTGQAGAAAVVPEELDGCNCIDLLIIRPGRSTSSSFLAHYLNSFYARDKITEYSVGSIQSHFNVGSMKNLGFPLIEPKEQERRASALDEVAGDLNLLDLRLETQLALLGERRQALITAAVTGQIDVSTARGLAPDGGHTV